MGECNLWFLGYILKITLFDKFYYYFIAIANGFFWVLRYNKILNRSPTTHRASRIRYPICVERFSYSGYQIIKKYSKHIAIAS